MIETKQSAEGEAPPHPPRVCMSAHAEGKSCVKLRSSVCSQDPSCKAYKDSKLCGVLFARELARRLAASGVSGADSVVCNAFSPGFVPSSELFRNQSGQEGHCEAALDRHRVSSSSAFLYEHSP